MKYKCQHGVLLGSILWAISLAASGQTATDMLSGTPATATLAAPVAAPAAGAPVTPSDLALSELKNNQSLGPSDAAGQEALNLDAAAASRSDQLSSSRIERARANKQPSNFQRFVQQATGRQLPIYGEQLFSAPSGYVPITQALAPNDYILGPGDEVRLQIWGSIDVDKRLVINRSGQVYLPKIGTINLTGVRAGDLESVLRSKIGRIFTNFDLNATLGRLRSVQIFVVGQALQPGTYTVSSLSTLIMPCLKWVGPAVRVRCAISS